MSIDADRNRLSQARNLESLTRNLQITEMVTVYYSSVGESHNHGIYCALIPNDQIKKALSKFNWDFSHGEGLPSSIVYHEGTEKKVQYLRYGNNTGIEPLIIDREFDGIRDYYMEISEEFRLFHKLYHDRKTDQYIKIDDDGNETVVAIVAENCIKIRVKEIRQFLAIRDMHLAIQFDYLEYSVFSLDELGILDDENCHRDELVCWRIRYNDLCLNGDRSFSLLLGKQLIEPLSKSKSGFGEFAEKPQDRYLDFIISVDENGEEMKYTSNPEALANFFGANPDAPNYLTPVHFRKQVLDKYYQKPSKYSVGDSILWCGTLWSLRLDNHHDDKVCVWLGDIGSSLSYEEQLHWRAYNTPPEGNIISETYYRRQLLGQWTDSDRTEHLFIFQYNELYKACEDSLDWQFLLPLSQGDEYHLKCMRIPATDEQRDFDGLILGLTKILIDSLNEEYFEKIIPKGQWESLKGSITRLEAVLKFRGIQGADDHIAFLRKLQKLRSSSSAHRKGTNYRKIATDFGVDSQNLRSVFAGILNQALKVLEFFTMIVREGQLIQH